MPSDIALPRAATGRPASPLRLEIAAGLIVALAALGVHVAAGMPTLDSSNGDNDSVLRLVQVRDLLAGQGWFDMTQYRMGPAGGFTMHWSRLVDAPIAAIVLAGAALLGSQAAGELVAAVLWPTLLLGVATVFLLRIARALGGPDTLLPTAILGGAALHFTGIFAPGALDHHNVQLALTLGVVAFLAGGKTVGFAAAGVLATLMLAVGMETAPYVAVAGVFVALAFALTPPPLTLPHTGEGDSATLTPPSPVWGRVRGGGTDRSISARAFGLAFAATAAVCLVATVPWSRWSTTACDAYSAPHATLALLGGVGLALASVPVFGATLARRIFALGAVGVAAAAVAVAFFPQCLGDPFAGLDPRLKEFWLSSVTEALPIWTILDAKPAMAPAYYATPLIGLAWLAIRVFRRGFRAVDALVGAFLLTAILVSFWQVRGAMFSIPLAAAPLSVWAAETRAAARASNSAGAALTMAAAWLLSLNMAWSGSANFVAGWLRVPGAPQAERLAGACYAHADYALLAAQPATTVLAVSNLGAPILRNTGHRALAGPYHRNVEGNLLVLDAFMGTTAEAEAITRANKVGLLADCPGNDESGVLAEWAPQGFMAELRTGRLPAWMTPVAGTENAPVKLYRTDFSD